MIIDEEEYLAHYGTPRHSGRWPWGSGDNVPQHGPEFADFVKDLRKQGVKDTDIAEGMEISTTELRARMSIANNQKILDEIATAKKLKEKGMSNVAIAIQMYDNPKKESVVRSRLAEDAESKANILMSTANVLEEAVKDKRYIDVGKGVEKLMGVSSQKLKNAVAVLVEKGYKKFYLKVPQLGAAGNYTSVIVLAAPGTDYKDFYKERHLVSIPASYTIDAGETWMAMKPPISIDPKRVAIKYKEDGGDKLDGMIYVREGVKDVSLGKSRYAQVRIRVGEDRYMKGMAMYSKDLPDGVDLLFHTAKAKTSNNQDNLKEVNRLPDGSVDEMNPFGATIKLGGQQSEILEDGTQVLTSVMNIVNEEGDWSNWSKNLSSQMLSKQPPTLARRQLNETYDTKLKDFEEIQELTNPVIQKKLLEKFAESADSSAVHLKAASLPKQGTHVILPIESLSSTEIYAPNYDNGEKVVLIRYPHGGTFEIPELIVNNNHPEAKALLGPDARDAVGINHEVAERLSGADFDGDTVLVIPNSDKKILTSAPLERLKGFDPKEIYKLPDDAPWISNDRKQALMGQATNLVADMTIRGATADKIARAVAHTMVIIDAEKHHLDVKRSAQDFGIAALKEEFQGPRGDQGASTLITRAKSRTDIPKRKLRLQGDGGPIDRETGELVYVPTNETRIDKKTGEEVISTFKSKKLKETKDAHELVSDPPGTTIERIYADHSNRLKDLANKARLASLDVHLPPYNRSANVAYREQVDRLKHKLNLAVANSPKERAAQIIGNAVYRARLEANPNIDSDAKAKMRYQSLTTARARVGAKKPDIVIEPDEWDAIQAGAISGTMINDILDHADLDVVRRLATPKDQTIVSDAKLRRIHSMMARGLTRAEISRALGIALGTLDDALYEGGDE